MSVYPKTNPKTGRTIWHYDFVIEGRRFHGSTGQTTRRAAEAFETRRRREVAEGKDEPAEVTTLDIAAGRWWRDIGQHRADASSIRPAIAWIIKTLGPERDITKIRTSDVFDLIAKRREQPIAGGRKPRPGRAEARKPVSGTTVKRTVIEVLRPILAHAATAYDLALPRIEWRKASAMLAEPRKPVREEFTAEELEAWAPHLSAIERAFVRIDLRYGLRFGEMFFPPEAVEAADPADARLRIGRYKGARGWKEHRKGGGAHVVPLLPEDAELLAALAVQAKEAGLDTIWAERVPGPRGTTRLVEITYSQMQYRLRAAAAKAGLNLKRLIHGIRHHAGTSILRNTGNLKLAQRTLGHSNIATTQRYAHANEGDIRAGLAAVSRHSPDMPETRDAERGDPDDV